MPNRNLALGAMLSAAFMLVVLPSGAYAAGAKTTKTQSTKFSAAFITSNQLPPPSRPWTARPTPTAGTIVGLSNPSITRVAGSSTSTTITVSWQTNVPARSRAFLSASSPVDANSAMSLSGNTFSTNHLFTFRGLAPSTAYYFIVESEDFSGSFNESDEFPIVTGPLIDTVGPKFLKLAYNATATAVTVTWQTNEPSSSEVAYGMTSPLTMYKVSLGNNKLYTHSVTLGGLAPDTQHYFIITSTDRSENMQSSQEVVFRTMVQ